MRAGDKEALKTAFYLPLEEKKIKHRSFETEVKKKHLRLSIYLRVNFTLALHTKFKQNINNDN